MSDEERTFALVQLCVVLESGQQSVVLHLRGAVTCYHYAAGLRASPYVLKGSRNPNKLCTPCSVEELTAQAWFSSSL